MSVIISFANGTSWYHQNWVFRQLAETIFAHFPGDEEMHGVLEEAHAISGLNFINLEARDKPLAVRTLNALKTIAEETLNGEIVLNLREHPEDPMRHQQYLASLTELLNLIKCKDENR